jgi:hypothetical protein
MLVEVFYKIFIKMKTEKRASQRASKSSCYERKVHVKWNERKLSGNVWALWADSSILSRFEAQK